MTSRIQSDAKKVFSEPTISAGWCWLRQVNKVFIIVMGALNAMKFYDIFTVGLEKHLVDFFPVSVQFSLHKARWVAFGQVGSGKKF